jgi:glycosyltransferase involved in cell wall biosynthesis
VVSPFPQQRSGVADYTAFTFGQIAKHADVEVYAQKQNGSPGLRVHPLSAEPYLDGRFDAVVNVVGNSHFHFGVLDLMGSYGGACIAHDNRMVESYDYDRGAAWTAQLISTPGQTVRPDQLPELIHDLDRLPAVGYDMIARQASPLIVHGRALADAIFDETGVRPVVVPFVPYNVPSRDVIDDAARRQAREALGMTDDVLHVATFGVVDRRTKGNGLIVAAVPWLLSWGIPTRLHIVGDSPAVESRTLRRLADDLDIRGDIVMHGHVPRRTLEQFLIGIDVAVQLRTSARLSLSGGVLDCFAFGVPTVTTENVADELDAPSYVMTTPAVTSSLLVAEAVAGLRDRRWSTTVEIDVERRDYLRARSVEGYAQAVLAALELGST